MKLTIGIDNSDNFTSSSLGATSKTISFTIGQYYNTRLVVAVAIRGSHVTGISYNGVAMTRGIYHTQEANVYIYYLDNPDVGTHNTVVSLDSSVSNIAIGILSLYHIDYLASLVTNDKDGTGTSASLSFSPPDDGYFAIDCQFNFGTTSGTKGSGQTTLADLDSNDSAGISYKSGLSAGSNTMSWTGFDSGSPYSYCILAMAPVDYKQKVVAMV